MHGQQNIKTPTDVCNSTALLLPINVLYILTESRLRFSVFSCLIFIRTPIDNLLHYLKFLSVIFIAIFTSVL